MNMSEQPKTFTYFGEKNENNLRTTKINFDEL